jgi:hypothetical protein
MPPPAGITFPTRRFVVTQVDEVTGAETVVIQSTALPVNATTDASLRSGLYDNARTWYAANPGIYRIYSPCAGAYYTDGDVVWDSRISGEL